jgi:hypothetical protein
MAQWPGLHTISKKLSRSSSIRRDEAAVKQASCDGHAPKSNRACRKNSLSINHQHVDIQYRILPTWKATATNCGPYPQRNSFLGAIPRPKTATASQTFISTKCPLSITPFGIKP